MKIKMLTNMAGPDGVAAPGTVIERPEAAAYDLIERGFAEQVPEEPKPKPKPKPKRGRADRKAPETASTQPAGGQRPAGGKT